MWKGELEAVKQSDSEDKLAVEQSRRGDGDDYSSGQAPARSKRIQALLNRQEAAWGQKAGTATSVRQCAIAIR